MELIHERLTEIGGGNPVTAVAVAVQVGHSVYVGTFEVIRTTEEYSELGKTLSERLFEATHPDALGKMVFSSKDFVKQ